MRLSENLEIMELWKHNLKGLLGEEFPMMKIIQYLESINWRIYEQKPWSWSPIYGTLEKETLDGK